VTFRLEHPRQEQPAVLPLHRALPPRTRALFGAFVLLALLVALVAIV
jgi:hypothetical protein